MEEMEPDIKENYTFDELFSQNLVTKSMLILISNNMLLPSPPIYVLVLLSVCLIVCIRDNTTIYTISFLFLY